MARQTLKLSAMRSRDDFRPTMCTVRAPWLIQVIITKAKSSERNKYADLNGYYGERNTKVGESFALWRNRASPDRDMLCRAPWNSIMTMPVYVMHRLWFVLGIALFVLLVGNSDALNYSKPSRSSSEIWKDMMTMDREVHERLEQLHAVIDALQNKVVDTREGRGESNRASVGTIEARYERLSAVLGKISLQNAKLHGENKALRQSNSALTNKISALEAQLRQMAEKGIDIGVETWLQQTALELKNFLEINGLEHFSSPRFSPAVAGLVSNGVILLPVAMSSLFLLNYSKQLSVLRVLMATNLFEVGVGISVIVSSVLLLGDPLEGMRHISEANFIFVQIVLVSVFWVAMVLLIVSVSRMWQSRALKYCVAEIVLKCVNASIYTWHVWVPAMEQDSIPIRLPPVYYVVFVVCSFACMALTVRASRSCAFNKSYLQEEFHHEKNIKPFKWKLEQDSRCIPFHRRD